jgi:hypothetical protein
MTKARTLADFNAAGVLTSTSDLNAQKLTGNLPVLNASALTHLNASNLSSGTTPNARYGTPTFDGANLTNVGESNTPAFAAQSSLGFSQTVYYATWTRMSFPLEVTDTDSAYDTSPSRFTVPSGKGGLYSFQYSCQNSQKLSANKLYSMKLYVNGSSAAGTLVRQNPTTTGTYDVYLNGSASLQLEAGDYVEVFYWHNAGGSVNLESDHKRFSGFRVT